VEAAAWVLPINFVADLEEEEKEEEEEEGDDDCLSKVLLPAVDMWLAR
jgi:hypothetical protein